MKAIVGGRIVLADRVLEGMALLFDSHIRDIVPEGALPEGPERLDARGGYVLPGFIDVHIHGYLGRDVSEGHEEDLPVIARGLAQRGVTGFLPTTMTLPKPALEKAFGAIRGAMAASKAASWPGAAVLGCHAEGPFISPKKRGAQALENIRAGDADLYLRNADVIRLCTVAPEEPGNLELIRTLREKTDIVVSMGHTAATYQQAVAGIDAGVRHATHLFNAMSRLDHREPGAVGAALLDGRVECELICDTFHVHPSLFQLVARMKGDKLILITDCLPAGGMPDGSYTLGGQRFTVRGIECRLEDGTIAGSVLSMDRAVRNLLRYTDLSLPQAVAAASLAPARSLGLEGSVGSIEKGKRADLVLADEDLRVRATLLSGREIFRL